MFPVIKSKLEFPEVAEQYYNKEIAYAQATSEISEDIVHDLTEILKKCVLEMQEYLDRYTDCPVVLKALEVLYKVQGR